MKESETDMDRREFIKKTGTTVAGGAFCLPLLASSGCMESAPRFSGKKPNIIYIALEDITPMMGCYGDTYAKTPIFDKLANEGIHYTHAYSVAPVCSVSR